MLELPTELSHRATTMTRRRGLQLETIRWPNGPYCPHLRLFDTVRPTPPVQGERRRLVLVHAVPPEIHGARWLHFPPQPCSLAQMASRLPAPDRIEKGFLRASATSDPQRRLQDGMVHRAPHPRVHGRRRCRPGRWREKDGRS